VSALGLAIFGAPLVFADAPSIAYLLRDLFTDPDGTNVNAHTMNVGAGWTVHLGTANIQSNQYNTATNDGGTGQQVISAAVGVAAMKVSATVRMNAAGTGIGLVGRLVDASNFWVLTPSLATGTLHLFENSAGVFTQRAVSGALGLSAGVDYGLELTFSGNNITGTITIAGTPTTINFTSAVHNTATRAGIRSTGVGNRADDFAVVAP
jgi:hypothetical protein